MARGATTRPRDRFDDVSPDLARVGAHRAPARSGRGFVTFAWAALATGVLVGAGVLGLSVIEKNVSATGDTTTSSAAAASSAPAATVDPSATVVVLNATKTTGLAASAAATAKGDGWKVASTANADSTDVKLSTVYYSEKSQLGAALGLAKSLGIGRAPVRTDRFDVAGQSRLTVVLGKDFVKAS
ncbi:LytR C-terminal domain-containing protein [Amnibacterium kyonggiense]|uniref:LytR cell envelope-related transcriptional attenuator n=1 Tax=Amnibacterium kyonggiense TaxID=595671 RepID=A0A4V3EB54_9MICO|nr:LytR C-terminal domain-containing protein [Amnibacterium kyonggiense]TDS80404.1 LytR cell envelope-related transcriptional attenuator [Amnibacterium kyonggiense]